MRPIKFTRSARRHRVPGIRPPTTWIRGSSGSVRTTAASNGRSSRSSCRSWTSSSC